MRLLIADDDFVSRNLLHVILLPYGRCDFAGDGMEALAAIQAAWEEKRPYDLIILDIGMPELDGLETLKQLRALEEQRGNIWTSHGESNNGHRRTRLVERQGRPSVAMRCLSGETRRKGPPSGRNKSIEDFRRKGGRRSLQ